ncbi:response regulator transcription factor [Glaciibacter psychrotolerans]|uniref:DNA-binding response OmpR family regulator n=1 Tax=Glaciibacter psychrotolerans TaxID=670054 RepID=A0A7Z0J6N9_9MICO|nr:response regulator transcription factor [Leifsonia psychrotolerans]NYJ20406.1 DNA-binding response OmpR family regulator [Leifsonia psychrotolerans]
MHTQGERRIAVIIEDDIDIRHLLETVLGQAGFETVSTANGLDGIEAVREHDPIVTTLDVSMPGIDGFEVAKRIRTFSSTYLVMLTARDEEIDMLQGLDSGADDYVTKPFRPRELRARIEAMLRRPRAHGTPGGTESALVATATQVPEPAPVSDAPAGADMSVAIPAEDNWLRHNGLRLNAATRIVTLHDDEIDLTRSEFELLAALLESGRRVRSKQDLALLVRGDPYLTSGYVSETDKRAVEVHLTNLRRKLGDNAQSPRFVETVRGVGYRLSASRA